MAGIDLYELAARGKRWLQSQGYMQPQDGDADFRGPPAMQGPPGVAEHALQKQDGPDAGVYQQGGQGTFQPGPRSLADSADVNPLFAEQEQRLRSPNPDAPGSGFGPPAPEGMGTPNPDQATHSMGKPGWGWQGREDTYTKTPADWSKPGAGAADPQRRLPPTLPDAVTAPKGRGARGGGATKQAAAPGADPAKTGSVTNPTSAMEDDGDLGKWKDLLDKFQGKPTQVNLKPLLALTDAWTGSRLADSYQAPMSAEQKDEKVLGMQKEMLEKEAALKYKKAYLSQQAENARALQQFRSDRLEQQGEIAQTTEDGKNARSQAGIDAKGARATAGAAGGGMTKAESQFYKMYMPAFKGLSQKLYGKVDANGQPVHGDTTGLTYAPMMAKHAYRYVQYLQANPSEVEPGMTAEEQVMRDLAKHPVGPDGLK